MVGGVCCERKKQQRWDGFMPWGGGFGQSKTCLGLDHSFVREPKHVQGA